MTQESTIIRCDKCGTKNKVPLSRINDRPVCGRCHVPLSIEKIYDFPVNVSDQTFANEIIQSAYPVLLDCWAPWCGPCRMVGPVLEQLAKEYAGRVKIAKLNVDENPVTASKYSVQSIPTMLFFKNGKLTNTIVGALPKNAIEEHIHSLL